MAGSRLLVLALVLSLVSACAYYNVYWMAKSEYGKAVEGSQYDFLDPYTQPKLGGEATRLIDSCLERCGKLLLLHPNSRWVDNALLLMGNCFLLKQENANAMKKYDELLQLYASSDLVDDAKYMKAYTSVRQGSAQKAAVLLEGLLDETERKDIRERATYLLGRVLHQEGNCERAINYYSAYLDEFKGGRQAGKVRLHLASCMLRLGRGDEVIAILGPLSDRQDAEGIAAGLEMGRAYRVLGQPDMAIGIFTAISESAVEDSVKARAKIEIAEALLGQGELEAAVDMLREAGDIAGEPSEGLRAEAIYAVGMIYEKRLLDFDQATASYEGISRSKSEFGKMAATRARALKAIKKYETTLSDSIPDSLDDQAQNRFKMAETYMEDLDLPEKAFEQYKAVADSFAETEFGARAMLTVASLLEAEGDTLARVYYRRVIENFPNSVYANLARWDLGLPLVDIVAEAPDTSSAQDSTLEAGQVSGGTAVGDSLRQDRRERGRGRRPRHEPQPDTSRAAEPALEDSAETGRPRFGRPELEPAISDTGQPDEGDVLDHLPHEPAAEEQPDTAGQSSPDDTSRVETTEDPSDQNESEGHDQ
jgi:TolA-binding protein